MKRHINIPIFIPHLGCPNACVFCNQRSISGVKAFDPSSVVDIIEEVLSTAEENSYVELAFFGGSFTGIDPVLMEELLKIANRYLIQGRISSIRCSTRPDYINAKILDILKRYGVGTIELGIQSISDKVLHACNRGHTSDDSASACALIKEYGFRLGGQMMVGLPTSTVIDEIKTAEFICSSGCDECRIYPTIVFKDTALWQMARSGIYNPLSLEDAVLRSASVLEIFVKNSVNVLRIGLCDSENLHNDGTYFAGPNHAAIGELIIGEYYFKAISKKLEGTDTRNKILKVTVSRGSTSKVIGQQKKNKIRLLRDFGLYSVKIFESADLIGFNFLCEVEERI